MKLKTKFQDDDFELGEVVDAFCYGEADRIRVNAYANDNENGESYNYYYNSIKEFTDHWEDAPEEPRSYWCIDWTGGVNHITLFDGIEKYEQDKKQIGNYFETREEAEAAVEKLKAFKRLKENGFKFTGWGVGFDNNLVIKAKYARGQIYDDMNLLFRGE